MYTSAVYLCYGMNTYGICTNFFDGQDDPFDDFLRISMSTFFNVYTIKNVNAGGQVVKKKPKIL